MNQPMVRDRRRGRWRRWQLGVIVAMVAAVGVGLNTGFQEPPRFDGAGYAMLGVSLLTGQGYRDLDHPDQTPHNLFPPGYPFVLAALWSLTGPSAEAAHVLSWLCTISATVLAWRWFGTMYPRRVAFLLGLALACNWTWHRNGGSIQSEPLFLFLGQLAILAAVAVNRGERRGVSGPLGLLLGAAALTRQAGLTFVGAIVLDFLWSRRVFKAIAVAVGAAVVVAPWVYRQATIPTVTQVEFFPTRGIGSVLTENARFYLTRLPDTLTGPFLEIATVFRPALTAPALVVAVFASGVLLVGTLASLGMPRRRLASLLIVCTLAMLLIWPFTEAGRFLVPLVPSLLIVGLEGLAWIAQRLRVRQARTWAALALLFAALPYSGYALITQRASAQRQSHAAFDEACRWIDRHADRPGPVLTAYPGELFWLTGRTGLVPDPDLEETARLIDRYQAAYLLVTTSERFARASTDPLTQFVSEFPHRVKLVFEGTGVAVYEVRSRPAG